MIDIDIATRQILRDLRAVVQRLTLVSHAPSQSFNPAPPEDGKPPRWRTSDTKPAVAHLGQHSRHNADTAIPRGGIDHKGDRTPEFRQKSADHFVRRLNRLVDSQKVYAAVDLQPLLDDATAALEAWGKTPLVAGERPAMSDPRWKYWAANCDHPTADLVRWYGIKRQYLHQIRREYRVDAA